MANEMIICPKCKIPIALNEAMASQFRDKYEKHYQALLDKKEAEWQMKESALLNKSNQLAVVEKNLQTEIDKRVTVEKEQIRKNLRKQIEDAHYLELTDLQRQLEEKQRTIQVNVEKELELRKRQRELEEKQTGFQLEMQRALDIERARIKEDAAKVASEASRMKMMEKDKQLDSMRRQIEELQRKAEQGSEQTQGEVLELDLEGVLKANFPLDQIEPVPKGFVGADIIQKVHNSLGQYCGSIIWEAKRTKAWSDDWIAKLKNDQRSAKAEVAILMSVVLSKDFGQVDGVWISDPFCYLGLVSALRGALMQLTNARAMAIGKGERMEAIFQYLTSTEFRQKVDVIVETFTLMKQDLDVEKRNTIRLWGKREKQLERVIANTGGMYGDLQGLLGATLPSIKSLDLEALPEGKPADKPSATAEDDAQDEIPF
jgi:hypothetical protein